MPCNTQTFRDVKDVCVVSAWALVFSRLRQQGSLVNANKTQSPVCQGAVSCNCMTGFWRLSSSESQREEGKHLMSLEKPNFVLLCRATTACHTCACCQESAHQAGRDGTHLSAQHSGG